MSTIATPRDLPVRRVLETPTSSNRPSVETVRSLSRSPSRGPATPTGPAAPATTTSTMTTTTSAPPNARRHRAALREYYNIKTPAAGAPVLAVTEADAPSADAPLTASPTDLQSFSDVAASAMDAADFDADAYVRTVLATDGLEDLLRTYTRVLGETRALDAEKKSLVYDNYSRLITATETIRKMRATMDPLNPMARTLDPAIAHIYQQASALREALRASLPAPLPPAQERARVLAAAVLQTPAQLRALVTAGRVDEARVAWDRPRRLLQQWLAQGVGGHDEVAACLAEGDAALEAAEHSASEGGIGGTIVA